MNREIKKLRWKGGGVILEIRVSVKEEKIWGRDGERKEISKTKEKGKDIACEEGGMGVKFNVKFKCHTHG